MSPLGCARAQVHGPSAIPGRKSGGCQEQLVARRGSSVADVVLRHSWLHKRGSGLPLLASADPCASPAPATKQVCIDGSRRRPPSARRHERTWVASGFPWLVGRAAPAQKKGPAGPTDGEREWACPWAQLVDPRGERASQRHALECCKRQYSSRVGDPAGGREWAAVSSQGRSDGRNAVHGG